jgi:hypothetical protein
MKNKSILFLIILSFFLIIVGSVSASTTNGTIDANYHYAWGENIGFVDFANITITDSALSGSIYGENIGWIDLATITNTSEGILSGYAWGENIGWVDFSKTTIGTDGVFTGGAYGENIGWITFGTGDNKVLTDWRPLSVRLVAHSSGDGGYLPGYGPKIIIPVIPIIPTEGCAPGNLFNTTTGNSCTVPPTIISGCDNRNTGFSITTGQSCVGNPLTSTPLILVRTLRLKILGEDVKQLQIYLNTHGYVIALSGPGSLNHETTKFGLLTFKAVLKFQRAHHLFLDGVVGPLTRALLK